MVAQEQAARFAGSPTDAARAHFCSTCWGQQIRDSSQAATRQGTNNGRSSHLMQQRKLRHPLRPRRPLMPAHQLIAAQLRKPAGQKTAGYCANVEGAWNHLSSSWAIFIVAGRWPPPQMAPAVLQFAAAHRLVGEICLQTRLRVLWAT